MCVECIVYGTQLKPLSMILRVLEDINKPTLLLVVVERLHILRWMEPGYRRDADELISCRKSSARLVRKAWGAVAAEMEEAWVSVGNSCPKWCAAARVQLQD